jgi:hypothetical protein
MIRTLSNYDLQFLDINCGRRYLKGKCQHHSRYYEHRQHGNKLLRLTLHILSDIHSTLKGFW